MTSRSTADIFISIHANASKNRGTQGMEVYYLRDLGWSEKNEPQRTKNHKIAFKRFTMKKNDSSLEKILNDMMYTYKKSESKRLARFVMDTTARKADIRNLGAKSAGFFVLRNTLIPAILVEVGYVTNFREEDLLKNSWYRQKIADGLAKSILEYGNNNF